jgi:TolB-like protein/Tfp pilus assembly protein PilF
MKRDSGSGSVTAVSADSQRQGRGRKVMDSIAVLPLANPSSDAEIDYLCEGIAESLINNLSQLPKLRVIQRTKAFRYKGTNLDPQEAGRALNVRGILTGRVLRRGDSLVVKIELVDVDNDAQIWGEQYSRKMADILSLEETISDEVGEKLRGKLGGEPKKRIAPKRPTENNEAYQLYLKGRYHHAKRTPAGLRQAIDFFQQAIDRDPNYALAYSGLADAYAALAAPYAGVFKPADIAPRAKATALKALQLDPMRAEAHLSLAAWQMFYDWDFAGAERSFLKAIEINPEHVGLRLYYPYLLCVLKRLDEAVAEAKRCVDLDPLDLIASLMYGQALLYARIYEQALEVFKKLVAMEPRFHLAQGNLSLAYTLLGRHDEAIACIKTAISLAKVPLWFGALGYLEGLTGNKEAALACLQELDSLSKHMYVSPDNRGSIYLGLRDLPNFQRSLEEAFQERSGGCIMLGTMPLFDSVRSEPFFQDICRRVGLP